MVIILLPNVFCCAIVKQYVYNRGNDFKDIVNIGIEKNIYGISIGIGGRIGYQDAINGIGYGLRYGHFGVYETGDKQNKILIIDKEDGDAYSRNEVQINPGDSNFYITTMYHKPRNAMGMRAIKKRSLRIDFINRRCPKVKFLSEELTNGYRCSFTKFSNPGSYELSVGYYLGFRIGVNLVEIIDFVFGFIGVDIGNDDISYTVPRELPQPTSQNQTWESKLDALDEKMDSRAKK